jgi:hypothetical protein
VRLLNRYLPHAHAAAAHDPALATAILRVTGLLDPPTALLRPDRLARVLLGRHPHQPVVVDQSTPARPTMQAHR